MGLLIWSCCRSYLFRNRENSNIQVPLYALVYCIQLQNSWSCLHYFTVHYLSTQLNAQLGVLNYFYLSFHIYINRHALPSWPGFINHLFGKYKSRQSILVTKNSINFGFLKCRTEMGKRYYFRTEKCFNYDHFVYPWWTSFPWEHIYVKMTENHYYTHFPMLFYRLWVL